MTDGATDPMVGRTLREGDDVPPLWLPEATTWLDESLAAQGIRRLGDLELARVRPWATVLRADTTAGVTWFKACGPGTAFEVPLYELAHRQVPAFVLEPVAIDIERSWMVLPDGGPILADELDPDLVMRRLLDVLPRYAELQQGLAPHVDELLAIGLTDMGPAVLPERFEQALEVVSAYLARRGTPAEQATYAQLIGQRERIAEWSQRLSERPGGVTLDHNDLHAWNIFYSERAGSPAGPDVRFYDWGDAVVAHPFASMMIGLGWLRRMWQLVDDDPRIVRARDAYLEPFADLGSRAELVETLELACRLGEIARSLVWARALGEYGERAPDTFQTAPMEHLGALLDTSYLGDALD
jgi:hypothetical protein